MKKQYIETTQILTLEVTYINSRFRTEEELKKMLKADNVKVKSVKNFEHEISDYKASKKKDMLDDFMNNKLNGRHA